MPSRNDMETAPRLDPDLTSALAELGWSPDRPLKDDAVSSVWLLGGERGPAVLKRSRSGGRLLSFLPRFFTSREVAILERLEGIPGIPRVFARIDTATFVREFVDGVSLREATAVRDGFFADLLQQLVAVHARGVACVDLSKPENVIVSSVGDPVLMDFQASWYLRPDGVPMLLLGWALRLLQRGDVYHVYKHRRRRFPEASIPVAPEYVTRKPLGVRLHALFLRRPYLAIKRRLVGRTSG